MSYIRFNLRIGAQNIEYLFEVHVSAVPWSTHELKVEGGAVAIKLLDKYKDPEASSVVTGLLERLEAAT